MKKIVLLVVFGVFFNVSYAQQVDRIQRGQRGYIPPPIATNNDAYIEIIEPFEEVEKMMPKCISVLKLDAFEQEIIKGMLLKKFESQNFIVKEEKNTREDRKRKLTELDKEFFKELSTILSPEEIEAYKNIDFKESSKEKKKRKKNKKN
jgi:hypothetical protein